MTNIEKGHRQHRTWDFLVFCFSRMLRRRVPVLKLVWEVSQRRCVVSAKRPQSVRTASAKRPQSVRKAFASVRKAFASVRKAFASVRKAFANVRERRNACC